MSAAPSMQAFLEAANALYGGTDNTARRQANDWLQEFQQTPDAWKLANDVLLTQHLSLEQRLLAALTFHKKVVYDLNQLPLESQHSLRDTLLVALQGYASGPRVIQTRICLALSALALQMPSWENPVGDMIAKFGSGPSTVSMLLEFLTVLPDEVTNNNRIPILNDEYYTRVPQLLGDQVRDVLQLLVMYLTAPGVTTPIQASVFRCMQAWLNSGEVTPEVFATTPLLAEAIKALGEDLLFDEAVEVVCVWIKETQELDDNMQVISTVLPLLVELTPQVAAAGDDEDRVRGFARVFGQAAETWSPLYVAHPAQFQPLVQVLLTCSDYRDLDIVSITFRGWYYLASAIWRVQGKGPRADLAGFRDVFQELQNILIRHLRFPDDEGTMNSQERDDFRDFRHAMGDTLKDCCEVLGADVCLARSLALIQSAMNQSPLKWQDIEAPLFSMRAMGTHIDPTDEHILPQIMDIVPQLPPNPRLKYAGLLVLGRYTEWVATHPDRILTILTHISNAFNDGDKDVTAAAARALRFLCIDCSQHLGAYLPQLFEFFGILNSTLSREELLEVSEAIAHIISVLPAGENLQMLLKFVQPVLQTAAQTVTSAGVSHDQLRRSADALKQVDLMLKVNVGNANNLPDACTATAQEAYQLLDSMLQAHGDQVIISESVCALLRRGIQFFGQTAAPIVPTMVLRLASAFEGSGHAAYVWIIGASIDNYGRRPEPELRDALTSAFNTISSKVFKLVDGAGARLDTVVDVIDDYVHAAANCCSTAPWILLLSPHLDSTIHLAINALDLYQASTIQGALTFLRDLVGHDALSLPPPAVVELPSQQAMAAAASVDPASQNTATLSTFAAILRVSFTQGSSPAGPQLVQKLLFGLAGALDPEDLPISVSILRMVAGAFPSASLEWVTATLPQLPATSMSPGDKQAFFEMYQQGIVTSNLDLVRNALNTLYRSSRRTRDRARMDRIQD